MLDCPCQTAAALCEPCRDSRWMQLRGVAARRGELWGYRLRATRPLPSPERLRELAGELVADMARDLELRAKLAAEAIRFALR